MFPDPCKTSLGDFLCRLECSQYRPKPVLCIRTIPYAGALGKGPNVQEKGGKEIFLQLQHFSLDAVTRLGKDELVSWSHAHWR